MKAFVLHLLRRRRRARSTSRSIPRPTPRPVRRFADFLAMAPSERDATLARPDSIGWVGSAALYGLVEAQVLLGQMHLDGRGTPGDPARALTWFAAAAGAGHPPAVNMLGRCHELGWGTPPDLVRATALYRQAAEAGLDWAQFNLGMVLLPTAPAEALRRFRQAADQGHAKAANLVGRCLENGWGVPPDRETALRCYARAAEGGDFRGQYNLGSALAQQGRKAEAMLWLSRALAGGPDSFLERAGQALMDSRDPDYRGLGRAALGRARG